MNKEQKEYLCIIIAFFAGLIIGIGDTSLFWYCMYSLSFIWGINFGLYYIK